MPCSVMGGRSVCLDPCRRTSERFVHIASLHIFAHILHIGMPVLWMQSDTWNANNAKSDENKIAIINRK